MPGELLLLYCMLDQDIFFNSIIYISMVLKWRIMTLLMRKIDFRFLKDSIDSTTRRWERLKKADSGLEVSWVSQLKRGASYPCAAGCVPLV